MKKLVILLGALALFIAQPLAAQFTPVFPSENPEEQTELTFRGTVQGSTYDYDGSSLIFGPYWGSFGPTNPQFTMYCVDFLGGVVPPTATINVTRITAASDFAATKWKSFAVYEQVAFLSSLFKTEASSNWSAIHGAIWSLTGGTFSKTGAMLDYLAMDFSGFISSSTTKWYVLTDVNLNPDDLKAGFQEFIVQVPEPGVLLLLLGGLFGVFFIARRRSAELL